MCWASSSSWGWPACSCCRSPSIQEPVRPRRLYDNLVAQQIEHRHVARPVAVTPGLAERAVVVQIGRNPLSLHGAHAVAALHMAGQHAIDLLQPGREQIVDAEVLQ